MVVRGRFAVPMQSDSQRIMLYYDINYVNVENEIEVSTRQEFENCNFQQILLKWDISVIIWSKLYKS